MSTEARGVVITSEDEARRLKHNHIATEQLLVGLLCEKTGVAALVLRAFGLTPEGVRDQVLRIVGTGEKESPERIPMTPAVAQVFKRAGCAAVGDSDSRVDTGHLLVALVGTNQGVGCRILRDCGVDPETIWGEVDRMRSWADVPLLTR